MKKKIFFATFIAFSGLSWGQNQAQKCFLNAIEESKFQGITQEQSLNIQDEYKTYCDLYFKEKDRIIPTFNLNQVITNQDKDRIIKEISTLNLNQVILLAQDFFKYTHKVFLDNKTTIPQKDLIIFREINTALKQRMYSFPMPKKIEKLPQEQRQFALRNIHLWKPLENKEKTFQNIDSVLYPVEDSIYVIKSIFEEKKSQLNFNRIQCEISLTYFDSSLLPACKKQLDNRS